MVGEKDYPPLPSARRFVKDGASLLKYLKREEAARKRKEKKEGLKKARMRLLSKGIPVCEEAMADSVVRGRPETLDLFLKAGFSPDTRDGAGVPLLNLAARAGRREMAGRLLKAGAGINQLAADRGSSALIDAVMGGHGPIVEDLVKAGAALNLKSKDGQSALILAVGANDQNSAELLLRGGAAADEPDSLGASARKYALLFKKPGMTALFDKYAPEGEAAGKELS
jgi:ankyrin repeat protein